MRLNTLRRPHPTMPAGRGGRKRGTAKPPPVSPHPEAGAKRHQKDEGGWLRRPRSFEALALRGRLRMRGAICHPDMSCTQLRTVNNRCPEAQAITTHLPLEGGGRREAAGGRDQVSGMLKVHPTPELRSDPPPQGEGGCRPPPVSPRPEAQAVTSHLPLEGGGRREAAGGGDHICGRLTGHPTPKPLASPSPQRTGR